MYVSSKCQTGCTILFFFRFYPSLKKFSTEPVSDIYYENLFKMVLLKIFKMKKHCDASKGHKITQGMSCEGNCYDNAVIESFFGIMKSEFLYLEDFKSIEHLKKNFKKYINY